MVSRTVYVCSNCGYKTTQWYGKCPNCQEWGTLKEIDGYTTDRSTKSRSYKKPKKITYVDENEEIIGIDKHFNSFLSNGLVRGGVYLLSGSPGVGKSTLLLQLAQKLSKNASKIVYVSAEESVTQVSMRAKRLSVSDIYIVSDDDVDSITSMAVNEKPDVLIIDSIHTIHSKDINSLTGSIQQVRYSAERIIEVSKKHSIASIIVAHITKDGSIAGPKMLEHMVDSVLFLDGDEDLRILRLKKHRFGSTDESLIMEMGNGGLSVVDEPTVRFLDDKEPSEGVAYGMIVEGQYPIVIEVQALCVDTPLAIPRRISVGYDLNRLNMLLAVIEKKLSIPMFKYDVYLNVAGGIKVSSTLADMAVAGSILSSINKKILPKNIVMVGEFDLSGNIRFLEKYKKHVSKIKNAGFSVISSLSGVRNVIELAKKIRTSL